MSRGVLFHSEDKGFEVIFRALRNEDDYSDLSFDGEEEGYEALANDPEYIAEQEQRREARSFGGETEDEPAVEEEVTEEAPAEEVAEEDTQETVDEPEVEEDAPADDNVDTDASDAEDVESVVEEEDAETSDEEVSEGDEVYAEESPELVTDESGYLITGEPGYGTAFQAKQELVSKIAENEPAWDEPVSVEDDVDETVDADADAETAETEEVKPDVFEAVTTEDEPLNKAHLAEFELPVEPYNETEESSGTTADTGVEATAGPVASTEDDFDEDAFALDRP